MKKVVKSLLSLFLSISLCFVLVHADNSTATGDMYPALISEEIKMIDGQEIKEYVYLIENVKYISEVLDNEIFVYDENYNLLVSAVFEVISLLNEELDFTNDLSTMELIDDYDEWLGWRETEIVQFVPNFSGTIEPAVLGVLMGAAFTAGAITISSLAISTLCGIIASGLISGTTVYVKGDFNYNKHCDILRKERVNQYNANGTVKVYGTEVVNWLNTPWDYTTPAACRVLTERY